MEKEINSDWFHSMEGICGTWVQGNELPITRVNYFIYLYIICCSKTFATALEKSTTQSRRYQKKWFVETLFQLKKHRKIIQ